MSKALSIPNSEEEAWAVATLEAITTLRDTMARGGYQDRVAAAKQVLDRTRPVPKASSVQIVASAVDRGQATALAKVSARSLLTGPEATDATFTDVRTLHKGAK